eukprot:scaffold157174_cov32-Tisochrysis_lutea.AAC.2
MLMGRDVSIYREQHGRHGQHVERRRRVRNGVGAECPPRSITKETSGTVRADSAMLVARMTYENGRQYMSTEQGGGRQWASARERDTRPVTPAEASRVHMRRDAFTTMDGLSELVTRIRAAFHGCVP